MENRKTTAAATMIDQVRDEWLEIGLDTRPIDREKVLSDLGRLYALASKPAPKNIVYMDSPLQISLTLGNMRLGSESVRSQVSAQVSEEVMNQLGGGHSKALNFYLQQVTPFVQAGQDRNEIYDDFCLANNVMVTQVENPIQELVMSLIRDQIREPHQNVFGPFRASNMTVDFGQFAVWLALADYLGRSWKIDISSMTPHIELAKACGWAVLFWDWAFISAKPECIHRDEQGRLHCETGPAVRYPDGFASFAIRGVRVPEKVAIAPETITISDIEAGSNAEVRRVMIERYGMERYLTDSGAEEIHRDDFGVLYRKEQKFEEPLVMVKVVNSTPEPDGSFKDYFLRVPLEMERAKQAVAWTFGKEENEYSPALQT